MMQDIDLGAVEEKDWKCATFKQVVDLTEKTDEVIAKYGETQASSMQGDDAKVEEAVEAMLELEKKARLGGDVKSTLRLAVEIINLLVALKVYQKLMTYVEVLMKRRAQVKNVQLAVIKFARKAIDGAPEDEKISLIKKLRDICQGKLHVELEFAQLSVELVEIWEAQGKKKESADIMQDVQVETIGNMERTEKLRILLLQIRLNLDVDDFIRAAIMARKTTSRALSKPDSRLIKMRYYELMIRYYGHFDNYWYLAKCWMELFATALDEETKKQLPDHPLVKDPCQALSTVLIYLCLSPNKLPTDREQTDAAAFSPWNKETNRLELIKKYSREKLVDDVPDVGKMADYFLQKELVHWPQFAETYKSVHDLHSVFKQEHCWEHLHNRVTEHNVKVISMHYKRISVSRLSELIDLTPQEAEQAVCRLVIDSDVWARVDRIDGIITFAKQKSSNEVVTDMKSSIDHVLSQIASACHLIHKESMLHAL
ncbi:26S proteasome non-ATPase regulatory subunit 12 [Diplonema papillatum]|nr:26S proteasome non-ATPase regulatory subunit 12 [Diplonema papillatum]